MCTFNYAYAIHVLCGQWNAFELLLLLLLLKRARLLVRPHNNHFTYADGDRRIIHSFIIDVRQIS